MIKRGYIGDELKEPCLIASGIELSRLFAMATPGKTVKLIIEPGVPWSYNQATVRCGKSESSAMVMTNGLAFSASMTAVQCLRVGMVAVLLGKHKTSIRLLSMKVDIRQVAV